MKIYGVLIAGAILLSACSTDTVKLKGRFSACSLDHKVYLEMILPGSQQIVDSMSMDRKCSFSFNIKLPDGQTTLYNLRYMNDVIPVMLSPGEKVTVNSIANLGTNYSVEGSRESERIRELTSLLNAGAARIDSLGRRLLDKPNDERMPIWIELQKEYNVVKRAHLAFIISEPTSLSSLYALYQRLPNDNYLFNAQNDIIYYRQIADSTFKYHPDSPYVIALKKEVESADNTYQLIDLINRTMEEEGNNFIDLNLPDIYGNKHQLSSLKGNVIIVDFWTSSSSQSRINNAELRKLYDQYANQGLAIYQVSADQRKAEWVKAVQAQKVPWITVSDLKGPESQALRLYNISSIPVNFIIDRKGNVVERNIYGDKLANKIAELIKQ